MSGNAVKRFRGRVRERCVELMFKSLDQGATFHHATEHFIAEPSSRETGAQSFIVLVARCEHGHFGPSSASSYRTR